MVGRRTRVDYSGSIFRFASLTAGRSDWGYDDRNEVTSAYRYNTYGTEVSAQRRVYAYDPIGNRQSLTEGTGAAQYYWPSVVNTYQTRDDSSTRPPPAPVAETFAYDEDGNMTGDMNFTYTWDAENRLSAVQTRLDLGSNTTEPDSGDKRLEFKYDYCGRRVEKTYQLYNGSAWVTQSGFPQRYVYDGWNVVLTLNSSGTATAKYTWGLDLSGSLQGAGGIGGLLAAKVGSTNYWYFYDGNGNVVQAFTPPGGFTIMSAPPDGVVAHYEYDPYGNVVASVSGTYTSNPFRFSTKWCDYELGSGLELYYYGYRYYSPRLGRWLSRDPMGERGGLNLLAFGLNDSVDRFDPLGDRPEAAYWGLGAMAATAIAALLAAEAQLQTCPCSQGPSLALAARAAYRDLCDAIGIASTQTMVKLTSTQKEMEAAITAMAIRCAIAAAPPPAPDVCRPPPGPIVPPPVRLPQSDQPVPMPNDNPSPLSRPLPWKPQARPFPEESYPIPRVRVERIPRPDDRKKKGQCFCFDSGSEDDPAWGSHYRYGGCVTNLDCGEKCRLKGHLYGICSYR